MPRNIRHKILPKKKAVVAIIQQFLAETVTRPIKICSQSSFEKSIAEHTTNGGLAKLSETVNWNWMFPALVEYLLRPLGLPVILRDSALRNFVAFLTSFIRHFLRNGASNGCTII
jgi:hypothetical protein